MADISRVKLQDGSEYSLKDAELRHIINVLLGVEEPDKIEIENPVDTSKE